MEPDYKALGVRIQTARRAKNISQEALCNMTDLSQSHLSHIENGRTKVSLPTLLLIANALKTTLDSLMYDNTEIIYDRYDESFRELIADCTPDERAVILQVAIQVKAALKRKK